MAEIILKYIGKGAYLPGVPTRDLTDEDLQEIERALGLTAKQLVSTLLYQTVSKLSKHETKIVVPEEHKTGGE